MSKVYRARERLSQKMLCICFMMPWVQFPVLRPKTKTNKTEYLPYPDALPVSAIPLLLKYLILKATVPWISYITLISSKCSWCSSLPPTTHNRPFSLSLDEKAGGSHYLPVSLNFKGAGKGWWDGSVGKDICLLHPWNPHGEENQGTQIVLWPPHTSCGTYAAHIMHACTQNKGMFLKN